MLENIWKFLVVLGLLGFLLGCISFVCFKMNNEKLVKNIDLNFFGFLYVIWESKFDNYLIMIIVVYKIVRYVCFLMGIV